MQGTVRLLLALVPVCVISACYVVPERAPDGSVIYQHYPLPPAGSVVVPGAPARTSAPATLPVRLYPSNEIASQIVDNLNVRLAAGEQAEVSRGQPQSIEAYNLYLKGRHFWSRFEEEGFLKGMKCFQKAKSHITAILSWAAVPVSS